MNIEVGKWYKFSGSRMPIHVLYPVSDTLSLVTNGYYCRYLSAGVWRECPWYTLDRQCLEDVTDEDEIVLLTLASM